MILRRVGKVEVDAEVVFLCHRQVKFSDRVVQTNPCNRWKMHQIQCRHETLRENLIELGGEERTRHEVDPHAIRCTMSELRV